MAKEIMGIPLEVYASQVISALNDIEANSDGRLVFEDISQAADLDLTPEAPYSAKKSTQVRHLGETVGSFVVIVFSPEDGTGNDSTFSLNEVEISRPYHRRTSVLPRSKAAVHTEIHVPISSHVVDSPNMDPGYLCGNLDVLGFKPDNPRLVAKVGELGQHNSIFLKSKGIGCTPANKATVGFRNIETGELALSGARFGDPHAIYNPWLDRVQVCGFLAVTPDLASRHISILDTLNVHEQSPIAR
jgi:hypothetical protein